MVIRNGSPDSDTLQGSPDNDSLSGRGGNDLLLPLSGQDSAYGGTGDDIIAFVDLTGGQAFGGAGSDTLKLTLAAGPALFLDMRDGSASQSGTVPGLLSFTGMERLDLLSQADADTVFGSNANDSIFFGGRGSTVQARGGDDLVGYIPNLAATLNGGAGNDTLRVDAGSTTLYFIVDTFEGNVDDGQLSRITGFETYDVIGGANNDIVSFDSGNDSFQGGTGNDTVFGFGGNDLLDGEIGFDSLLGGDGNDTLVGGNGNDLLYGGTGRDVIRAGKGDDLVDAGSGADRIILYLGHDTITGGAGADAFMFIRNELDFNLITDFTTGQDRLVFEDIFLPSAPPEGPLDPSRLAIETATGTQAQFVLRYDAETDVTVLHWDTNGADPAGGTYGLALFSGAITIAATDIFII